MTGSARHKGLNRYWRSKFRKLREAWFVKRLGIPWMSFASARRDTFSAFGSHRSFIILYAFEPPEAQQGARANAHSCHAACYRMKIEMNQLITESNEARGAPAAVVAHL
jgi:hypothetical protein